ncbi:MAG: hypothetical protein NZ739_05155 [Verrucomicrobiae bacterium]|nr:hypothetical protein [Verrucomicrobiae bacterium]MDW7979005.1 hypothetical protein [Verrucomicrobiales bacterium]
MRSPFVTLLSGTNSAWVVADWSGVQDSHQAECATGVARHSVSEHF